MASVNPYLSFRGNAEEAFNHYKSVFGGDFVTVMRWKDMPSGDACDEMPQFDGEKIMHVSLPVGDKQVIMGADMPETEEHRLNFGNNFTVAAGVDSREEADRIYAGLSEGGAVVMPMGDTFWGSYFGMCTDKFGIQWMVSYDKM